MPELSRRPCLKPLCPECAVRNGRCEEHAAEHERQRGKTAERGYDAAWRRVRGFKLRQNPFCEIQTHCGKGVGRADPDVATEVDHMLPISQRPDLRLKLSNLQSACKPCNAAKGDRYPV